MDSKARINDIINADWPQDHIPKFSGWVAMPRSYRVTLATLLKLLGARHSDGKRGGGSYSDGGVILLHMAHYKKDKFIVNMPAIKTFLRRKGYDYR